MRFTNDSGLPGNWTMGFQRDGRELLVIIVKGTYTLPKSGEEARVSDNQIPLVEADQFTGEPGQTAPTHETDFAHRKLRCDVLLLGSAYAPAGKRVTRTRVGLRVGALVKQFDVVGNRVWQRRIVGIKSSNPEPFERLPIGYDCAFGGTDRTNEGKGEVATYLANPVGRGYWRNTEHIDGQPLPNTEEDGHEVSACDERYTPMAFSPIGRNWAPRMSFAGTYNKDWMENVAPLWPDDFDERYFQAAPPHQTISFPQGGEDVVLVNLTADGNRAFPLPRRRMPITFIPYKGRDVVQPANLDTIVLEPDLDQFTLTWRAVLPLGRSVFDVKETVVGEVPFGRRRAPTKPYYRGLDELVRARSREGARSDNPINSE